MYAIVNIAGQQFRVEEKQQLFVHRLEGAEGAEVKFEEVLLVDADGKIKVGTPTLSNASVSAKIIEHMKGDKVLVFKKKRRKGYKKMNGHRQYMSKIENQFDKSIIIYFLLCGISLRSTINNLQYSIKNGTQKRGR